MTIINNATNSTCMKLSNRRLILNIVRKKPVSRAELARITGLTRAAVTIIVNKLIKDGSLIDTGIAEADLGRKPVLLDLNSLCYYAVGVSITRDSCNIGIMNIKGVLLNKCGVNLCSSLDVYEKIKTIIESVKKIIGDFALPYERFLGIGISTPGPVDINTGTILNPPNFNIWHNVNIVQEFKKNFVFNIFLENNSMSLALAEKNYGRGSDYQSFMLMVVDSGVGAGIIINENIYRGAYGFGSEVGHISIDINGKACSCGNRGCVEVYASIPSVLENIQKYDKSITTWNEVVDRALGGEAACKKAIESEALYLSAGIVNAMNILELEAVVLTGDIKYRPEMILELIRNNVGKSAITRNIHRLHIMNSTIAEDSGVISAASIIFEKFFRGEI
jgi:predicted NBD/HSP70 family sugar kinase